MDGIGPSGFSNTSGMTAAWQSLQKKKKADDAAFAAFNDNQSLIDNPDSQLMTPKFKLPGSSDSKKRNKIMAGMLEIFNQRKNQILERKAQPGLSQTRLDYQ